jgi:NitT/TauT family transport system ATP-binding protein
MNKPRSDSSAAPASARISLQGVSKRFAGPSGQGAGQLVLDQVSLSLAAGEFVCLLGPSGCGKSTVLNLLSGFERADQGRVQLDGRPITGPGAERGMVFQQPTLFPWLSVADNVAFGPRMAGWPRDRTEAETRRLLAQVGLADFGAHFPWQLSGGMRQRAALAQAWILQPEILLMDEPFGALDAQTRLAMQELLTRIWQQERTTVLFVTHDVDEALFLADRVLIMSTRPGRIEEDLAVPFERPRTFEDLVAEPDYGRLKRRILKALRHGEAGAAPLDTEADASATPQPLPRAA